MSLHNFSCIEAESILRCLHKSILIPSPNNLKLKFLPSLSLLCPSLRVVKRKNWECKLNKWEVLLLLFLYPIAYQITPPSYVFCWVQNYWESHFSSKLARVQISLSQFLYLQNVDNNSTYSTGLPWSIKSISAHEVMCSEQCLALNKHLVNVLFFSTFPFLLPNSSFIAHILSASAQRSERTQECTPDFISQSGDLKPANNSDSVEFHLEEMKAQFLGAKLYLLSPFFSLSSSSFYSIKSLKRLFSIKTRSVVSWAWTSMCVTMEIPQRVYL